MQMSRLWFCPHTIRRSHAPSKPCSLLNFVEHHQPQLCFPNSLAMPGFHFNLTSHAFDFTYCIATSLSPLNSIIICIPPAIVILCFTIIISRCLLFASSSFPIHFSRLITPKYFFSVCPEVWFQFHWCTPHLSCTIFPSLRCLQMPEQA